MSRLIERFSQLPPGDRYRLVTAILFFFLGAVITLRGLAVGIFPVVVGCVFWGFGTYRLFYYHRFFRQNQSKATHATH